MIYTLENIRAKSIIDNPVKRSKVIGKRGIYKLLKNVPVRLSNDCVIIIEKGFTWNLASVPQLLQNIIRESGDDDIAYLIHDYMYENRLFNRKFADKEMLKWAKAMKGTQKWSLRNWDIKIRYIIVRMFGYFAWIN